MHFSVVATAILLIGLAQAAPNLVARKTLPSCPPGAPTRIGATDLCTKYDSQTNNACTTGATVVDGNTYTKCSEPQWQKRT
ncbi:hypothetical protein HYFRA_00008057 [Hymenoscyphus fraxineus]|uniref:Uncharacterized protein n=1 Tax=Hymenoscyphus fraxineus TaxID=746836 RepID=A0A9N9PRB1_9HELO|nr:hypothetical protein HYFRA_00008057 [Hymenoscyphus fraxineus]